MQQLEQVVEEIFDPDSWETPDNVARARAKLVQETDRWILEPCAGTGQICKAIDKTGLTSFICDGIALEINPDRARSLKSSCKNWAVHNFDFLSDAGLFPMHTGFDLICTNPPFSLALEFIERSLTLLNPNNPNARLLFLLPMDWMCSKGRGTHFKRLDAHISHIYPIMGRVAYLKNGVPYSRRQIYDCVFEIKPGREGAIASYLEV